MAKGCPLLGTVPVAFLYDLTGKADGVVFLQGKPTRGVEIWIMHEEVALFSLSVLSHCTAGHVVF